MPIEKKINKILEKYLSDDVFPSVSVGVMCRNINHKFKYKVSFGKKLNNNEFEINKISKIFDLASLTKPYSTVLSILTLIKDEKLSVKMNISDIFNEEFRNYEDKITIKDLLMHHSGLPAHRDYYKKLVEVESKRRKIRLLNLLADEPLLYKPGSEVLYSDLGYMLLGLVIEKVSGQRQDEYFREKITDPVGLSEHVFYNPLGTVKYEKDKFAPVEFCPWRKKVLRGEVSDENCWALGGVAGHAGLYGDIEGVLALSGLILDIWSGKRRHPNIRSDDFISFLTERSAIKEDTWAMGFDRPNREGASCGKYFSKDSVGHLGFTGTSFWIDPHRELVIAILSNRVHPSRDNEKIKKFRPEFHDRIVEWLELDKEVS